MNPDPTETPELLLQHAGFVRRLARRLLRDDALAEDVAQETWIAALARGPRSATEIGGERGVRAFLGQTAKRIALRSIHRRRHREDRERSVARPELAREGPSSEEESALRRETLERVQGALLGMEEPFRETLLLHFYEQLAPGEISRRLGVPRDTVYSRIRRGLEHLRSRLARDLDDRGSNWSLGLLVLARGADGTGPYLGNPVPGGAALATLGTGSLGLGATLMSTPMKLAAGFVLLGLGALCWWRPPGILADLGTSRVAEESRVGPGTPRDPEDSEPGDRRVAEAPVEAPARAETPATSTGPATGRLVLEVLYRDTGLPAVGRRFDLLEWNRSNPGLHARLLETDAHGTAEADDLVPGAVLIYDRIGGSTRAEILAGEETLLQHEVPRGIDLEGTVVDSDGHPVPGARIWLSEYGSEDEGSIVAQGDGQGRFELRCVGPHRSIGALAEGFAPTRLHGIDGNPGDRLEITLSLPGPGGWIEGFVGSLDGTPLGGIEVRAVATGTGGAPVANPDGVRLGRTCPGAAVSDATGRFELDSLPVGPIRIWTVSPDHAPHVEELDLRAGEVERLELRLEPAGRLVGTVTDSGGRGVEGARVETGDWGRPDHAWTRSGADGAYTLEPLAPGLLDIRVSLDDVGSLDAQVEVLAGEPTPWNPRLDPGLILEGTVLRGSGEPWAGAELRALSFHTRPGTRSLWSRELELDSEGGFRILACPEGPLVLELFERPGSAVSLGRRKDVYPGGDPIQWTLHDGAEPSARVHGSVRTPRGEPLGGAIWIHRRGGGVSLRENLESSTGRFDFGPLPSGSYNLGVAPTASPEFSALRFELRPDEVLDLGVLSPPEEGRLRILVAGHDGFGPFERIELTPMSSDPPSGTRQRLGTSGDSTQLIVGSYRWTAWGEQAALQYGIVDVLPAQTTLLEIEPRDGIPCGFELGASQGVEGIPLVTYVLFGSDGRPRAQWHRRVEDGLDSKIRLLPGRYRVRVDTLPSLRAEIEFEIHADDGPRVFELELE